MWKVSNDYKAEIIKKSVRYSWYGTIHFTDNTSLTFGQQNIDQNKSRITKQCVKGENLEVGNCFAGELVLGLRDTDDWKISDKKYDYYDADITLTFVLYFPGGGQEEVPCGHYTVVDAKRTYHTIELTAYDAVHNLETKITQKLTNNLTAYNALHTLCQIAQVGFAETQSSVEALPNGTETFPTGIYSEGTSCSEIFGNICAFLGVNAIGRRDGAIMLAPYGSTPVRTITASNRYSSSYVDYIGQYTMIAYVNKNGNEIEYGYMAPASDATKLLTMNLGRNELLKKMTNTRVESLLDNLLFSLQDVIFAPSDVTIPADPSLDIGDMVTLSGGELGNTPVNILCTKLTIPLFGQQKISSVGGNYKLDASNNRTQREKEQRNDEQEQEETQEQLEEQIDDINDDISDLQNDVTELQGMINVAYILPSYTDTSPIADGASSKVMEFTFSCENEGEVVSLYSMLGFTIATTVSSNQYNDAVLTVSYALDDTPTASASHTYMDGNMILTLNGLFTNLTIGNHVVSVTIAMAGGSLS